MGGEQIVCVLPGTWWHTDGADGKGEQLHALFAPVLRAAGISGWVIVGEYSGTLLRERAESALAHLYRMVPAVREGKELPIVVAWSAGLEIARIMEEAHCCATGASRLWCVVGSLGGLPRMGVPYMQVVEILWRRFGTVLGGIFRGLARYLPGGMGIPSHRQGMLCPEDMLVQDFFMSSPSGGAWGVLHGSVQVPESVAYVASVFFPGVKEVCAHAPLRAPIVALNAERDIFVPLGTEYPGETADLIFLSGACYGHAGYFQVEDPHVREKLLVWGERMRERAS